MTPALEPSGCLLCGGPMVVTLDGVSDNRFGSPGQYRIRVCQACGLGETEPRPDGATLQALYEQHYNYGGESGTTYTSWRQRLLTSALYRWWLWLDGDVSFHAEQGRGRLLDVGCNEGRGLLLYAKGGFTPEGLELNRRAAAAASALGFRVHTVDLADLRVERPFDRVVLSNVLEHALDPRTMLANVCRVLREGGEVWISLPNRRSWLKGLFGRHWINWHVPFHITHFTPETLGRLLVECGFAVVSVQQVTPALWVAQSTIAWAFAGRPDQPQKLRHPLLVPALMLVARFLLFPLIWIANRSGHGDCLVVKAQRK